MREEEQGRGQQQREKKRRERTLKVEENAIATAPGFPLPDNDGRVNCRVQRCEQNKANNEPRRTLLAEVRLAALDGGHNHVARAGSRETVEARLDLVDGNDVQVLGTAVVGAVDDGADRQTEGHLELGSRGTGCCK